jgi:hypothetical protein
MSRGKIIILAGVLLHASPVAAGEPQTTQSAAPGASVSTEIRKLIDAAGLDHLSPEDNAKVAKLLNQVIRSRAASDRSATTIADMARAYFEARGYTLVHLSLVRVKSEDWLVVTDGLTRSATKDLPLMFPTLMFRDGYYFCKKGIMGGITEMIDASGREQTILFADWKDLR